MSSAKRQQLVDLTEYFATPNCAQYQTQNNDLQDQELLQSWSGGFGDPSISATYRSGFVSTIEPVFDFPMASGQSFQDQQVFDTGISEGHGNFMYSSEFNRSLAFESTASANTIRYPFDEDFARNHWQAEFRRAAPRGDDRNKMICFGTVSDRSISSSNNFWLSVPSFAMSTFN